MKQPHFIKYAKRQPPAAEAVGADSAETSNESGEVVIRADMIFLGSSYPRRLRVVCFENPNLGLGRFAIR